MEKKSQDFSIKEAQRLANSAEGQRLMQHLQQADSARLQEAMAQAQRGNYKAAGNILQSLLASPQAQKLMRDLGEKNG